MERPTLNQQTHSLMQAPNGQSVQKEYEAVAPSPDSSEYGSWLHTRLQIPQASASEDPRPIAKYVDAKVSEEKAQAVSLAIERARQSALPTPRKEAPGQYQGHHSVDVAYQAHPDSSHSSSNN